MNSKISGLHLTKVFHLILLLGVVLSASDGGKVPPAHAQSPKVVLVPGTVTVSRQMEEGVILALQGAADIPPATRYFAISDLRLDGAWALVSVTGLAQVRADQSWSIDDGTWFGLILLKQKHAGAWKGAVRGTSSFSTLMDEAPDTLLDRKAKRNLDPLRAPATQDSQTANAYAFPWQPGTQMFYGPLGVHNNGWISDWKAVDMMSDGDTSIGHSPNRLLAAAAGTITYKCADSQNVAIHLGDFFYTHLVDNDSLLVGASFAQGADLGKMKTGSFNASCGYASQPSNWFHVHWGFANANLHVEDWTLSMTSGDWTNGTLTVGPGDGWIMAGPTDPCLGPALSSPADAYISTSQTIDFSWSAVSGCIFNNYRFRIKTVPTMDSGGTTLVNTTSSTTSITRVIPSDWNKQDLYWGVKAANAPFGAAWSVGHFSIDPGPAVPTDYGLCAVEWQWCAFSGTAQIYYGANDHFIGPLSLTGGVNCNSLVLGTAVPPFTDQISEPFAERRASPRRSLLRSGASQEKAGGSMRQSRRSWSNNHLPRDSSLPVAQLRASGWLSI